MRRRKKVCDVAEMRAHVTALLASLDRPDDALIVHWVKRTDQAKARLAHNEIWPPVVRSKITYATALHEIGHMLGRHRWSRYILTRERDAWRWAKAHALIWTSAMELARVKALLWYEVQFKNREFNQFGRKLRPRKIALPQQVAYYDFHQDRRGRWHAVETQAPQPSNAKMYTKER